MTRVSAVVFLVCVVIQLAAPLSVAPPSSFQKVSCSDSDGCTWDLDTLVCCKAMGFWPFCFSSCRRCGDANRDGLCDIDMDF